MACVVTPRIARWPRLAASLTLAAALALGPAASQLRAQSKPAPATPAGAPTKSPSAEATVKPPAQGQQLCVKAPRANLRAGPGAKFRVTWEVNRNMPLLQVGREGEWIKVRDVDGDLHWVSEKLITGQQDCVTVKAEHANIRKSPSNKADTWFTVEKYTSFHRIGQKDNWVKIEYEGETMWVAQSLVWPT
jgi:SH3-like domain-containing protein